MSGKKGCSEYEEEEIELRRGPWTLEEDTLLIHYIAYHGEGRWNLLARCSGLKRTGKSCRLRWLNYLKPDVKRGNLTPEEQILILDLHSKWGNRWSRIAQHLPGRTDNEIKNYWRTRVQKHARQLKIDANSTLFRDAVRCFWMPSMTENVSSSSSSNSSRQQQQQQHHHQQQQPQVVVQSTNPLNTEETKVPDFVQDPQPAIPTRCFHHDPILQFENYNSIRLTTPVNTSQFTPTIITDDPYLNVAKTTSNYSPLTNDVDHGVEVYRDMVTLQAVGAVGGSSVSDCSMMENNYMVNNIEESLWSIWMNGSNPESYMSGESRS